MLTLIHHPMSSESRYIRLILNEQEVCINLVEYNQWKKHHEFQTINIYGSIPVLLIDGKSMIYGASIISEYLNEINCNIGNKACLFPKDPIDRAEVRRLCNWFLNKFDKEITKYIVHERIYKWQMSSNKECVEPDSIIIRMARNNIHPHMQYLNWLSSTRDWIAGIELSYADFAASASISVLDYMGEIDWPLYPMVHEWYARIKSRPSFRPILNDVINGIKPIDHYKDLDF